MTQPAQSQSTAQSTGRSTVQPTGRSTGRSRLTATLWHLGALVLLVVLLYPLAWLVSGSFKPTNEIVGDIELLPASPSLDNYRNAVEGIAGVPVTRFFVNSLLLAAGAVVGTLVSCSLAAYGLARIRFRGRGLMFAVMISTLLLPYHVLLIPQYVIFQRMDLVDTYVPLLIGKYLAVEAFFVFLMVQFMRGLPPDLDDAAKIDGCGHWRIYWRIVLPLTRPALITAAIFSFIWTWNDFLPPLIYLNSPAKYPLPLALSLFIDQQSTSDYGAMVALSLLALLPVVLFFLAFQRFLVEGVATSGLKG